MRPPELPGGNSRSYGGYRARGARFNEAAGITRRKPDLSNASLLATGASMRPPELPGGNQAAGVDSKVGTAQASMRPPELPGGNGPQPHALHQLGLGASMRPPELPGGNPSYVEIAYAPTCASMRPPELPGGNGPCPTPGAVVHYGHGCEGWNKTRVGDGERALHCIGIVHHNFLYVKDLATCERYGGAAAAPERSVGGGGDQMITGSRVIGWKGALPRLTTRGSTLSATPTSTSTT